MGENDWLTSENPEQMLAQFQDRIAWRKQRLFACRCVRLVWHHLLDERFRALVELSERCADGGTTGDELVLAAGGLVGVVSEVPFARILLEPSLSAMAAVLAVSQRSISMNLDQALKLVQLSAAPCVRSRDSDRPEQPDPMVQRAHRKRVADILRDIVGNPFHAISLHLDWLSWNNGTVGRLAETMYEERRYQDLPVLADALEEAGCDVLEVLEHLRERGEHARGCWALDLSRGA